MSARSIPGINRKQSEGAVPVHGRRVVVPGPRQVQLEAFDLDEHALLPHEALVRTRYSTISPGTELSIYTALDPGVHDPQSWCHYPFQPGYIAVGEVLARGDGGKRGSDKRELHVGDLIYFFGKHASIQKLNTNSFFLPVPKDADLTLIGLTRMATVAMTAVRTASAAPGDVVVVIGLGLVGNLAAQLFTLAGIETVGVDLSDYRIGLATRCGVSHVINPSHDNVKARVHDLTGGRGAHTVVDAVGDSRLVIQAAELAARRGEVILLGTPRASYETDVTKLLREVHMRGVALKGALEWLYPTLHSDDARFSIEQNARYIMGLLRQGRIHFAPLLTHILVPKEFQSGYEGLLNEKDSYTGVAINWADG